MTMLVPMVVTAADGCGDADVLLPRASFRCQDRKRWADFFAGRRTPAYDIRSENIRHQVHFLRPPTLLSALCCCRCTFSTRFATRSVVH